MARTVVTFLMFQGSCEEAITHYVELFADAELTRLERWGPDGQGVEGQVSAAEFTLAGHRLRAFDSPPVHAFTFTPSVSIFVDCDSEQEVDRLFDDLSTDGEVFMPLATTYGFSTRFGWCADRWGVSWQLNLP